MMWNELGNCLKGRKVEGEEETELSPSLTITKDINRKEKYVLE